MKLSVAILAHNEAHSIPTLLRSLWQQSWLKNLNHGNFVEIIVIPNGCTDNTAEVAQKNLKNLAAKVNSDLFQWKICEVTESGKSNAWNLFVHQFSAKDADLFCFMDADIEMYAPDTLAKMLDVLKENPEYWIALDRPIKDVELKNNKSFLEQLSVAVSKSSNEGQLYICGQLYCARASVLRNIWMPPGLPVEDGFLTQMIISENFTLKNPTFDKRIVRVTEASHIFEAYINPFELLNHEVRVVVGIVINIFLTQYFEARCNEQLTAGMLIAKMNSENHFWLNDFVKNFIPKRSWWIIPISLVFRRYRALKNHSLFKALLRIPIATLAFVVDLSVFIRANITLHRKVITNYW